MSTDRLGRGALSSAQPADIAVPVQGRAERRQLSVVFCDLVGSSELATRIDPEDLAELIGQFHRCVSDTMEHYGGFYTPPMGDGALVFFGFPRAHEDDVERAVRASLLTLEAVSAITGVGGRHLHARIGIATGIAIVGDVADTGTAHRLYAAGEALNLAARLQQLAEPDTLVIAENVRRLVGHLFVYRELGKHTFKGWENPIAVTQVLRPAVNPSRFEARVGPQITPLIGRCGAIEALTMLWREAWAGNGHVAFITGEMGIGKSRLVAELMRETALETRTRIRWFCMEQQRGVALHPCLQQLEHAAGIGREDPPALRRAKLGAVLPDVSAEDFILIGSLMQVPADPRSTVLQFSLQRRRERTLWAFLHVLARLCRRSPVLAIMEDAHWSDPTTAELLALVAREARSLPLLLVVTARPDFKPDWLDAPSVSTILLEPLPKAQSAELIRSVAGSDSLAETVVQAIAARCDGVPLFLEEVTRAVLEADGLAEPHGGTVPASIHASLLARLDRLGTARKVVEAAATIGRDFNVELLQSVLDGGGHVLNSEIRRLIEAGLVLPGGAPGSGQFHFKHALIQDAAYGMMCRNRRCTLHGRVARALETDFPQIANAEPNILAHHYVEAGLHEKAIGWLLRAGAQSLERAATSEGIAQIKRGLELCAGLQDTEARQRLELDLQIVLGKAIIATLGHAAPECDAAFARARTLCTTLEEPPQLLTVLFQEWTRGLLRTDFGFARQRYLELLARARDRRDPVWKLFACCAAGVTLFELGKLGLGHRYLCQGLNLFKPEQRALYMVPAVGDPSGLLRTFLAWERMCAGNFSDAWAACDAALSEARELRLSYALANALAFQTGLHVFIGAPASGLAAAEELQSLADEHGHAYYAAVALSWRGWCLGLLGRPDEGLVLMRRGNLRHRASGARLHLHISLRAEAELLGQLGDVAGGLARISEARSLVGQVRKRWDGAEIRRVEGELLAQAGDVDAGERALADARDIARSQGASLFELRASVSLAGLLTRRNRPFEAATVLNLASERFNDGCDIPDMRRARKLLRELQ